MIYGDCLAILTMNIFRKTRVHPLPDDGQANRPSTPPTASRGQQDPHPRDETPVNAGERNGDSRVMEKVEGEKKKRWWKADSFFRALKKRGKSNSVQRVVEQQQQQQQQKEGKASCSDDKPNVHDNHSSTSPKPSTSAQEQDPLPHDETPVDAGERNGQENRVMEKVEGKKKKGWWKADSFFRALKKRGKSNSVQRVVEQQQQQSEAVEQQKEGKATCSDDKPNVHDNHSSTPPKPSTSAQEQDPLPHDETPVDAGERNDQETRVMGNVEEKKKNKSWWRRMVSFFTAQNSSSEKKQLKEKQRDRCSDDYIFSHYELGNELGRGGFGVVYEGRRLEDDLKVAVKYVNKSDSYRRTLRIPGYSESLPTEIALTIMANTGPRVPEIIQLLDWQNYHDRYVMIFEHPCPCENLENFVTNQGGKLTESVARPIMWQVIHAVLMCCQRNVFHSDIKLSNLLINEETLEVKLIDFGCGSVLKTGVYRSYLGTINYCPPEYESKMKYHGKPATVWSLGILLFRMVCGHFPTLCDEQMIKAWSDLSTELRELLHCLLQERPNLRTDLEKILSHKWFKFI